MLGWRYSMLNPMSVMLQTWFQENLLRQLANRQPQTHAENCVSDHEDPPIEVVADISHLQSQNSSTVLNVSI